jgi:hypothetical protein
MMARIRTTVLAVASSLALVGCDSRRVNEPFQVPECEAARDAGRGDRCYAQVAEDAGAPDACDRIESASARSTCFRELGEGLTNPDLCSRAELASDLAMCLSRVAQKLGVVEPCKSNRSPGATASCVNGVALKNRDFDACTTIPLPEARRACQTQVALAREDADLCAKIDLEAPRASCYLALVGKTDNTENTCARIESGAVRRRCYSQAASHDPRRCELAGRTAQSQERRMCLTRMATVISDPEACDGLADPAAVDACLIAQVPSRGGDSICERVRSASARDECWEHLSRVRPASCLKIALAPKRQQCASFAYTNATDPAFCNLVAAEERTRCRIAIASKGGR